MLGVRGGQGAVKGWGQWGDRECCEAGRGGCEGIRGNVFEWEVRGDRGCGGTGQL